MIDWDSPTWGGTVHEASNGSWINTEEGCDEQ